MLKRFWDSLKYYSVGIYNYADEDHVFLLAAGIGFNVMFSILPLSLVILYVFSSTLTSQTALASLVGYLTNSFPIPIYEQDVRDWLAKEMVTVGHASNIAGLIGAVTLFWLASILFSTLRTSLNAVLNLPPKINVVYQKLLDFVLMIIILVLLLSSTFLSPIVSLLQRAGGEVLPAWLFDLVDTAIPRLLSLGISILLYALLFWMLPHQRLSRKTIAVSASTAVVLTEAMRILFVYYMKHISSIGTLYGTYAFIAGIGLWIYYASVAFLISAEVGWLYRERNEVDGRHPKLKHGSKSKQMGEIRHPGDRALDEKELVAYEKAKPNPTKPAGQTKE